MNKFLSLYAAFIIVLVSSVSAMPQEHLAPAVKSEGAPIHLHERAVPLAVPGRASGPGYASVSVHPRQVHNADYGSKNGPTGNPQTVQRTKTVTQSSTASATASTTDSHETGGATGVSSKGKQPRNVNLRPNQDMNYLDN